MSKLIVYSKIGCPNCKMIKTKLKLKNIDFEENTNIDEMIALGIQHIPTLSVDGKLLEFKEANDYINSIGKSEE